jgi:hypothetical protein
MTCFKIPIRLSAYRNAGLSEPHYYRIQTRDFLFEFDNVQGNANHIHEVWRSRAGDFGEDLLRRHRTAAH